MNDRELLEMAAKAVGIELVGWLNEVDATAKTASGVWEPLYDDGDAFRLAVKLSIDLRFGDESDMYFVRAEQSPFVETDGVEVCEYSGFHDGNAGVLKASRRAIVRAAAEIGRIM